MLKALFDLFYPEICAGCRQLLIPEETILCLSCRHNLPLTRHFLNPQNEALSKLYGRVPIESATCYAYYEKKGILQNCIHQLKYKGNEKVGEYFGHLFAQELTQIQELKTVDEIIPVPLHSKRLKNRGYNQVRLFAEAIAKDLSVPLQENLLIRQLYSTTQTKKGRLGRSKLDSSAFEITSAASEGKYFLLVDDVLTTGATLEACAKVLLKIPNSRVSIACIAFSHS